MFRYTKNASLVKPRYTLIAHGRIAIGGGGQIAWSHDYEEMDLWARGLGGDVVDADELELNFENQ